MNKGVVMEIQGKSIIVMTPSGVFERIPISNRSCRIGEEIMYVSRPAGFRQPVFAALSVFVAAVFLCMMLFTGLPAVFADKSVVAYISIDINPSVEIGIDKREKVREMHGLNEKGLELVRSLHYSGKPLEEVADKLLQKAEEMKIFEAGEADIVIASSLVKEVAKVSDEKVSEHLKQQVLAYVLAKHPDQATNILVTAFAAPSEVLESAKNTGLSMGKYTVYLNAKNKGFDLKVDDLKEDSVHQIAKEAGGISKLVDAAKLKKESLKELLKEEKEGKLDQKVQERKKEDEKKNTPKPGTKNSPAPTKSSSPTPATKPSTGSSPVKNSAKPAEASRKPDVKNDDKKNNSNKNDKGDKDAKDNGASSNPSQMGNSPNDKKADDNFTGNTDEDRSGGRPSRDNKESDSGKGKDEQTQEIKKDEHKVDEPKADEPKTDKKEE